VDRLERSILLQIAPPAVLINDNDEVIRYFGQTGRYLGPSPGVATLNLFQLLRMELRAPARTAVERARSERQPVVQGHILLGMNGGHQPVSLTAAPLSRGASDAAGNALIIVFREVGAPSADKTVGDGNSKLAAPSPLEEELNALRSQLTATVSELEVANEELKSSNEEYQSVNEELQSTNEELETSKEELQSVNEELQTVNHELTVKIDELDRANSDLKNLYEATEIATIFLDRELIIRSFTPAVTRIFSLIPSDRGRPLTDIAHQLDYAQLPQDIQQVFGSRQPIERRVNRRDANAHYIVRALPYWTGAGKIEGAVLTFNDVTSLAERLATPSAEK